MKTFLISDTCNHPAAITATVRTAPTNPVQAPAQSLYSAGRIAAMDFRHIKLHFCHIADTPDLPVFYARLPAAATGHGSGGQGVMIFR